MPGGLALNTGHIAVTRGHTQIYINDRKHYKPELSLIHFFKYYEAPMFSLVSLFGYGIWIYLFAKIISPNVFVFAYFKQ